MEHNKTNPTRFQEAREMAGISAEQAAKYLSFPLSDLLKIESGQIDISDEVIQRLAIFYEVDYEWLRSRTSNTHLPFLGDLPIAPRELEKISPEELPKLLQILVAIRHRK